LRDFIHFSDYPFSFYVFSILILNPHLKRFLQLERMISSPTGGGRSVGIVRSRTKATEFSLV